MSDTNKQLIVLINPEDYHSSNMNELLRMAFKIHRKEIVSWFSSRFPDTDFETFEGGIDSWFGLGSVLVYEFGVDVYLKVSHRYEGWEFILEDCSKERLANQMCFWDLMLNGQRVATQWCTQLQICKLLDTLNMNSGSASYSWSADLVSVCSSVTAPAVDVPQPTTYKQ